MHNKLKRGSGQILKGGDTYFYNEFLQRKTKLSEFPSKKYIFIKVEKLRKKDRKAKQIQKVNFRIRVGF